MKTSILIPVLNESRNIPSLLRTLAAVAKKTKDLEIIFVDNGSDDGSLEMLEAAKFPGAKIFSENRRGFAEPMNRALAEASGELLLFLDADAHPEAGWANAMIKAMGTSDLVVGQTLSLPEKKPTVYSRLAAKLFEGHSERTAHARGHALPWGPTCNLGARRSLVERVGPFSPEASSAFDIDWCWRALLNGAKITYVPEAKVKHLRRNNRELLLEQFERYGLGEAWLHRTYAFLLSPEDRQPDPLLSSVAAYQRLRYQSEAAKVKPLQAALEEVAVAFAGGVRLGYERPHRDCPLERSAPKGAIWWRNSAKQITAFVPGKGLASLEGKQLQLFEALQAGDDDETMARLFMKLFKANKNTALHEVHDFRHSLEPSGVPRP